MRTELEFLTNEQLLAEIKRLWYEKGQWDYEWSLLDKEEAFTPANDYMSDDMEQHIDRLENEYKTRGLELPDREEYVAQFMPTDEDNR